jgi:hypothetical protein
MKCIEIIELRLRCNDQVLSKLNLSGLISEVKKNMKSITVELFKHGSLTTDYSLQLIYNNDRIDVNGSPLGLHLVSTLKEFGLVNHSVWFKIDNNNHLII